MIDPTCADRTETRTGADEPAEKPHARRDVGWLELGGVSLIALGLYVAIGIVARLIGGEWLVDVVMRTLALALIWCVVGMAAWRERP